MDKIRILVTGAGGSAAYNFCQSLLDTHKWQFELYGTDINIYHLMANDLLAESYLVPKLDNPTYLDEMIDCIGDWGINLVHPQPDPEVLFIADHRSMLPTSTLLPTTETIALCQDKMLLHDRLEEAGVRVPEAHYIRATSDVEAATGALQRRSPKIWVRAVRGAGSRAGLPVRSAEQATAWINYWQDMRGIGWGDFMMSEFLPGKEYAWQSLWYNGELITSCARERVEYLYGNISVSGQSSSPTIAKTVHNDDVNEICTLAVKSIDADATGVFCIDLKENIDGKPCITEINAGRFFTTSYFFSRAGLNMPVMYAKLALGLNIDPVAQYNALPEGLMWVRQVDRSAQLFRI